MELAVPHPQQSNNRKLAFGFLHVFVYLFHVYLLFVWYSIYSLSFLTDLTQTYNTVSPPVSGMGRTGEVEVEKHKPCPVFYAFRQDILLIWKSPQTRSVNRLDALSSLRMFLQTQIEFSKLRPQWWYYV